MRAKYVKENVKQRLADKPGHSIFYSNSGYLIAGAMLEKIMGKPFEQLLTEEIFSPMGLHTAGFGPPVKFDSKSQPVGHSGFFRTVHPGDFPAYMAPAAAIHISIKYPLRRTDEIFKARYRIPIDFVLCICIGCLRVRGAER